LSLPSLPNETGQGTFQLEFTSGAIQDTSAAGAPKLSQLTFTLNYTPSSNVNAVNAPQAYTGVCTENPPAGKALMSTTSGISVTSFDKNKIVFTFNPETVPAAWEPTVNNFKFCVFFENNNAKVFEEVTVDLTLQHTTVNPTPVVNFSTTSNNVDKTYALTFNGRDVLATAVLCDPSVTVFQIGAEICVKIGLDTNGEYFKYKLDDGTPLPPFQDFIFTGAGGLSHTVTPATADTTVTAVPFDAVNSQEVRFYLPQEFYYSGTRTVQLNIKVNIVDNYGNVIARRLRRRLDMASNSRADYWNEVVATTWPDEEDTTETEAANLFPAATQEEAEAGAIPATVEPKTQLKLSIIPVESDANRGDASLVMEGDDEETIEIGVTTLIIILTITLVGILACCCCLGLCFLCGMRRRKEKKEEEEKETLASETSEDQGMTESV